MIKTKRWCDLVEPDDGLRVLVARYRPRGLPSGAETWSAWLPQLGPSKALHAAFYGKIGVPISWDEYAARYLAEMQAQTFFIRGLAQRHADGETLTLLCSSACTDEHRCHRSLLRTLMTADAAQAQSKPNGVVTLRRRNGLRDGEGR